MSAQVIKIEKDTLKNTNYRNVVYTSPNEGLKPRGIQVVLMNLRPKEEIGMEIHNDPPVDQFIKVEHGSAEAYIIQDKDEISEVTYKYKLEEGDAIVIPSGTWHNIVNTDNRKNLKLYTIYTPAEHPDSLIQKFKV